MEAPISDFRFPTTNNGTSPMHRALVICENAGPAASTLDGALQACGFEVARAETPRNDARAWSLIAQPMTSPEDAAGQYRIWLPWAGFSPGSGAASALALPNRVGAADVTAVLLAFGYALISSEELGALFDVLYELGGHDTAIVSELVDSLVSTNDDDLLHLRRALASGRWTEVATLAHRIKSVGRMLACRGLVSVCARLEAVANGGGDESAFALVALMAPALLTLRERLLAGPAPRAHA